jgi:hypothetical protein
MLIPPTFESLRHANKHIRAGEKRETVLWWLSTFHYSTRSVLSRSLGIDTGGQYKFFKGLVTADLVRPFSIPIVREELFLFTERALVYNVDPARIGSARVKHNLSVQLACLSFTNDYSLITSDRHLDFTDRIKLPDAIVSLPEQNIALEVEMTHKNTPRIFRAFYDSVSNIKAGYYGHVQYIFPNDTLRLAYLRHFNQPAWPVFERNKTTHMLRQKTSNGVPQTLNAADPRIQSLFTFSTQSLYV